MMYAKLLALALIALISSRAFESTLDAGEGAELGRAYYFGFEIERITGILEDEIEEYGCEYRIERGDFCKALTPIEGGKEVKYDDYDVRAKISFEDGTYFVDHSGFVKSSDGFSTIDKKEFVDSLALVGICR